MKKFSSAVSEQLDPAYVQRILAALKNLPKEKVDNKVNNNSSTKKGNNNSLPKSQPKVINEIIPELSDSSDCSDFEPPAKKFVQGLCPESVHCIPCHWVRTNPVSVSVKKTLPKEPDTPRRPVSPPTPRIPLERPASAAPAVDPRKKVHSRIVRTGRQFRVGILKKAIWDTLILPPTDSRNLARPPSPQRGGRHSHTCAQSNLGRLSAAESKYKFFATSFEPASSAQTHRRESRDKQGATSRQKAEGGKRTG